MELDIDIRDSGGVQYQQDAGQISMQGWRRWTGRGQSSGRDVLQGERGTGDAAGLGILGVGQLQKESRVPVAKSWIIELCRCGLARLQAMTKDGGWRPTAAVLGSSCRHVERQV